MHTFAPVLHGRTTTTAAINNRGPLKEEKRRRRRRRRTKKKKQEEEEEKKEEEKEKKVEEEEECILVSPSTLVIDEMTPKWRTDGRDYRMFNIGCCGIQHPKPTGFPSTRSKPQRPPRLLARPSGERANASVNINYSDGLPRTSTND
ncbi:hypothetical protein V1478_012040 [Vespula squamosa]|uniref:Uncharacterized protein n=1 Tax=Vespula squamosa TaxID=30214 RepID=A0ABD2AC29_VESSQ